MKKTLLTLLLLITTLLSQEETIRFLTILNYEYSSFRYVKTEKDTVIWEETGACLEVYPSVCFFQELRIAQSKEYLLYELSRTGSTDQAMKTGRTFRDSGTVSVVGVDSVVLQSTHVPTLKSHLD